ncbi:hypothetical protein, partial [Eggerthella sp.]|uniref:hypothetical protein n=1 Tax=Eggerthella sp. TaxID=1929886 RepID=UPI00284D0815
RQMCIRDRDGQAQRGRQVFPAERLQERRGTNHDKFRHPDGRRTVIERHSEISNQQFEVMKKQAGLK